MIDHINYDALVETELIGAVRQNCYAIKHIKNPSEAVCMTAVTRHGPAIEYIKNPSEAVCMASVEQIGWAIKYIQNPSEAVCMAAVSADAWAIQHIKNPSDATCIAVVEQSGIIIRHIHNPSEAVQIHDIKSHADAIKYIADPLRDVIAATHLLYYPLYPRTPKPILDRAPELLEDYCAGLGDVYTIGLSIGMDGDELSKTMIEWAESQQEAFHP